MKALSLPSSGVLGSYIYIPAEDYIAGGRFASRGISFAELAVNAASANVQETGGPSLDAGPEHIIGTLYD